MLPYPRERTLLKALTVWDGGLGEIGRFLVGRRVFVAGEA